jgi:4-hydroxy-4-methyl-2-oxoglutarate aldolase
VNGLATHGFIETSVLRPDAAVVERLAALSTCATADALESTTVMDCGIRCVGGAEEVCGPAITVSTLPGSLLFVFKAFELLQRGDVLVVDGGGRTDTAMFGSAIAARLKAVGCAGVVIDGAVRDVRELNEVGLPVFARGVTPAAYRLMEGPGSINACIQCGGVAVAAGDVIRADLDGVVVVPAGQLATTVAVAEGKLARPYAGDPQQDPRAYPAALRAEVDARIESWRESHPVSHD